MRVLLESGLYFSFCLLNCFGWVFVCGLYPLSCVLGIYYVLITISDLWNTFGLSSS